MRVVLLHDAVGAGSSVDELDVLAQMDAVEGALEGLGHSCERAAFSLDLEAAAARVRGAGLVFNLVESVGGQGRLVHLVPALLESLRVPFTGCRADATYTSANKVLAKRLMAGAGIATPAWLTRRELERGLDVPRGQWIIKSVWEHASRGLDEGSVVEASGPRELLLELEKRWDALGGEGLVERYVEGREFNLSILDGQVLPPAEIVFEGYGERVKVVGYRAKWDEASFEYHHTPRRFEHAAGDAELIESLQREALRCWECFGLSGYARVDFRVDEAGRPWVLEVNSNPCLSPDAGFAAAAERGGLSLARAIERIVGAAL
jgi:D-alanine-D-alanine ligase